MQNILIMLSGLPGTGKSTAAEKLAQLLDFSLVSLLKIRQEFGYKKYDHRRNSTDLEEMYQRTFAALVKRKNVIVDSVFILRETREIFFELALEMNAQVLILECDCPVKTAKKRMRGRPKNKGLIQEARNPEVYDRLRDRKENIIAEELPLFVSHIRAQAGRAGRDFHARCRSNWRTPRP